MTSSAWVGTLVRVVLVLALLAALLRWPRVVLRLAVAECRTEWRLVRRMLVRRAASRRRRRAVELRATAMRSQRFARPHHIYDELF